MFPKKIFYTLVQNEHLINESTQIFNKICKTSVYAIAKSVQGLR